jgi:outer membrane protein assembly factor BamB
LKKLRKNKKNIACFIALFLAIVIGSLTILLPSTFSHTPAWNIPTYAFINVAPNPAGLEQTVTIGLWLSNVPPTAETIYGDRWENMTVKVTKPSGTTVTLGPFTSDATGGAYTTFTPTELGNYSFQMFFGGQTLEGKNPAPGSRPNAMVGDYFQPSSSAVSTLIVQENPIPSLPTNPLPTEYWERPISSVNTPWYSISGSWLGLGNVQFCNTGLYNAAGNYNPYTTAPHTSHILWAKPGSFGGLLGGEFGDYDTSVYMTASVYEPKFAPIIMNGILFYQVYTGAYSNPNGFTAIDIKTGQTLWTKTPPTGNDTTILKCGQTYNAVNPNQYGAISYLWTTGVPPEITTDKIITAAVEGSTQMTYTTAYAPITLTGTTYNMYDAMTGKYILSIANATSMTLTTDESGSLIGYYVNASTANAYNAPTLNCWNSTQCILYPVGKPDGASYWKWRPAQDCVIPFQTGIMWSKPIATNISGAALPATLSISAVDLDLDTVLMSAMDATVNRFQSGYTIEAGYSLTTGTQLWITNRTQTPFSRVSIGPSGSGIYLEVTISTGVINGYSITTGRMLWSKQLTGANGGAPNPYNSIGSYYIQIANGTAYVNGFGGDVWAVDLKTGNILWYTNTNILHGPPGTTTPYGVWPIWSFGNPGAVADGVLFLSEGHAYSPPMFNGAQQLAINITNGELVWSILGFNVNGGTAVAEGTMVVHNAYDGQIYAYGKGASKTTVEVQAFGSDMVISGSVIDISAGTKLSEQAMRFPNGVPAVSDRSQGAWMEYVYMQQPKPIDATGVSVILSVMDSNNNYRTIGNTNSDANGKFAFTWKPDITGDYTVIASFVGSEAYYASSDETFFTVSEPPSIATAQPTQAPSAADLYFIPAIAGLFIAVIICIAMIALLLIKHS